MKLLSLLLAFSVSINIFAQNAEENQSVKYVEVLPVCLDCKSEIQQYIDGNITMDLIGLNDSIPVCFIVDSDGKTESITIQKTVHDELKEIISEAVKSTKNWIPGEQRGKPTKVQICFLLTFIEKDGILESEVSHIPSLNYHEYTSYRMQKYSWNYYENKSEELISHLGSSSVNSMVYHNIKSNNVELHKTRKFKTGMIIIGDQDQKMSYGVYIPDFLILSNGHNFPGKKLKIKHLPVGKEIVLLVTKEEENEIFISLERFVYDGRKYYSPVFKEFTFSELKLTVDSILKE